MAWELTKSGVAPDARWWRAIGSGELSTRERRLRSVGRQLPTNPTQIARYDAPADPALQAHFPMVGAALQPLVPPQTADAPLDAGAPAIVPAPGAVAVALALARTLGGGARSRTGDGDVAYP